MITAKGRHDTYRVTRISLPPPVYHEFTRSESFILYQCTTVLFFAPLWIISHWIYTLQLQSPRETTSLQPQVQRSTAPVSVYVHLSCSALAPLFSSPRSMRDPKTRAAIHTHTSRAPSRLSLSIGCHLVICSCRDTLRDSVYRAGIAAARGIKTDDFGESRDLRGQ